MNNPQIANAAALLGRIMLSALFITGGFGKLTGYAGAVGYMDKVGMPSALLPLVILTELGGGLLILVGWQTRIVSFLLAGFTALTALLVHLKIGDGPNMVHFWKNIAITGGFIALLANGAGAWSVDGLLGAKSKA
jgi:putative oxidoreductase